MKSLRKIDIKLHNLTSELVNRFGEGSTVTRKDILEITESDKTKYPNAAYITTNDSYKVGRNKFKVTSKLFPMYKAPKPKGQQALKVPKEVKQLMNNLYSDLNKLKTVVSRTYH